MTATNKVPTYSSSGGRKKARARAHLTNSTKPTVTMNGLTPIEYLGNGTWVDDMLLPLTVTDMLKSLNVNIKVEGGGKSGQAGAARLAIAKALLKLSEDHRTVLRNHELLTRDARVKERKKYGLKAARKAPQFSKR